MAQKALQIRKLGPRDRDIFARFQQEVYPQAWEERIAPLAEVPGYLSHNLGMFEGDQLICLHGMIPGQCLIRGRSIPIYFMSFGGTKPGFRTRGLFRQLFKYDIQRGISNHRYALLFDPFQQDFYHRMDCAVAMDSYHLDLPRSLMAMPDGFAEGEGGRRPRQVKARKQVMQVMEKLYGEGKYNDMLLPLPYQELWLSRKGTRVWPLGPEGEAPKGFLRYQVEGKLLKVHDFRYLDYATFCAGKNVVAKLSKGLTEIQFKNLPPDFPYMELVGNYWNLTEIAKFYPMPPRMMRVCDPLALTRLVIHNRPRKLVSLELKDELGLSACTLSFPPSGPARLRAAIGPGQLPAMGLGAYSQLITGRVDIFDLYRRDRLRFPRHFSKEGVTSTLAELNHLFPKTNTFSTYEY